MVYSFNAQFYRVFFRGVTWMRDSHGLFDYESKSIVQKNLKTSSQGRIFRVNDDIEFVGLNKSESDFQGIAKE